jgi:methyltransferase
MALNVLMHPRNPYRDKRPDFKTIAEKYELFREHVKSDSKGKVRECIFAKQDYIKKLH